MMRADVIQLVTQTRSGHGVHEAVTEQARTVFCTVGSVSRREYYDAANAGITPECVFRLTLAEDYQNERIVFWNGQKYRVIRTYRTEDDGIEITAERSDENGTDEIHEDSGPDADAGDGDG